MRSDDTFILGWDDPGGETLFIKTFDYLAEKEEAQAVLAYVSARYKFYKIGHVSGFRLEDNHDVDPIERDGPLTFNLIPMPNAR